VQILHRSKKFTGSVKGKKMKKNIAVINNLNIEDSIVLIRGQVVLIDNDIAQIYGVEPRLINQSVKRNMDKFPFGYIIKLSDEEVNSLRSQKMILNKSGRGQHSKYPPTAFTEKGLYMLATILKSPQATAATILIVETFARMRALSRTLDALSKEKDKAEQKSLLKRGGEIMAQIMEKDLVITGTETSFELNLAAVKIKHTVKKEKKK